MLCIWYLVIHTSKTVVVLLILHRLIKQFWYITVFSVATMVSGWWSESHWPAVWRGHCLELFIHRIQLWWSVRARLRVYLCYRNQPSIRQHDQPGRCQQLRLCLLLEQVSRRRLIYKLQYWSFATLCTLVRFFFFQEDNFISHAHLTKSTAFYKF